ncbi:MBL fold metallo-hydrolase [Anaerotalea alkaliphila]|uniref:MBL fold metallo-hydrolase n=1 Tax=Anaerotalea alkaliphila TaxID=2662126 RepID=A0A7X5KLI3_9FIRM|nr:MBL fold metallo-hydrolase [Anaerotalea alkaliphila]NDL66724.1 MBL fold metallo-hydrolase [Anaerotalea alkaliphila]
MECKIQYLFHSGFLVHLGGRCLVFDYFKDSPGSRPPALDPRTPTYVFSSHRHHDHFDPSIFQWRLQHPGLAYVLSDDIPPEDIPAGARTHRLGPHQSLELDGILIRTLRSNDEGVAFLVEISGILLYFAGDLNWWHWEGEAEAWNRDMAERYKREMALLGSHLAGRPLHLAFLPVDPRLGPAYDWNLKYFLAHVADAGTHIFPMHFGEDTRIFHWLERGGHFQAHPGLHALLHREEEFHIHLNWDM